MDLSTFVVSRVIVHQIPKARLGEKSEAAPVLSEVPSNLTPRLRSYFRERMNASFRHAQFRVEHDPESKSPVPNGILEYFESSEDFFVRRSREFAKYLYEVQVGNSSAGILAVVAGTLGSGISAGSCLAILKLEMDSALRIQPTRIRGKGTFELAIEDVTLNEAATVFKAALFGRASNLAELSGIASDNQRDDHRFGPEIASFFLRFLGCRLADNAERATKRYLENIDHFVNVIVDNPDKRFRYELSAIADLASPSLEINPMQVAEQFFDPEDRDGFLELFRDADGSVPIMPKETALVKARLAQIVIDFQGGLRLSGPRSAVEESVRVAGGITTIETPIRRFGRP